MLFNPYNMAQKLHLWRTSGFDFPGVVNASRLELGRGELGYCWRGLGNEPLSIFRAYGFCALHLLGLRSPDTASEFSSTV